jgi:hypothetical protein
MLHSLTVYFTGLSNNPLFGGGGFWSLNTFQYQGTMLFQATANNSDLFSQKEFSLPGIDLGNCPLAIVAIFLAIGNVRLLIRIPSFLS